MKTNQTKLATKIAECLTTRGSRVDWVKTEEKVYRAWKNEIEEWLAAGECNQAGAAMAHISNVSNSMKLLKKISRQVNKSRRELAL